MKQINKITDFFTNISAILPNCSLGGAGFIPLNQHASGVEASTQTPNEEESSNFLDNTAPARLEMFSEGENIEEEAETQTVTLEQQTDLNERKLQAVNEIKKSLNFFMNRGHGNRVEMFSQISKALIDQRNLLNNPLTSEQLARIEGKKIELISDLKNYATIGFKSDPTPQVSNRRNTAGLNI